MKNKGYPYGAPDFNGTVQLEFASTAVSGLLDADETYRISTDADCMVGFGAVHDEAFTLTNGCFLGADQEMYIETSDNSKWAWAVAHITTTSGIVTCTKVK